MTESVWKVWSTLLLFLWFVATIRWAELFGEERVSEGLADTYDRQKVFAWCLHTNLAMIQSAVIYLALLLIPYLSKYASWTEYVYMNVIYPKIRQTNRNPSKVPKQV